MRHTKSFAKKAVLALAAVVAVSALGSAGCTRIVTGVMGIDAGVPTRVVLDENVMVPMRDGVRLATDVYRPSGDGPWPVVLTRLPYGKSGFMWKELAKIFVRNGYVYVIQDTRGEFNSEGAWFPLIFEYDDGHDTVAWVKSQPWCNGEIGMWGGSYFGYTQLTAAPDNPDIAAMVPLVTSASMYKVIYRGGALELVTTQGWIAGERTTQMRNRGEDGKVEPDFSSGYFNEPIRDARELDFDKMLHDPAAIAAGPESWLHHPGDIMDLPPMNYDSDYNRVTAPSLSVAGWYDMFIGAQLHDFVEFRKQGIGNAQKTRIIVGPWTHGTLWSKFESNKASGIKLFGSSFMDWYDHWLKGVDNGAEAEAPLKLFIIGENKWRDEYEWPLARTRYTNYYLHSGGAANTKKGDGSLSTEPPGAETSDQYDYDPRNPVPTAGGCFLGAAGIEPGAQPQGDVPMRNDVLVFMTEPLPEAVELTGPIKLLLYADSSARDTDFVAKLLDVCPRGEPTLLQNGIIRARYRNGYKHPQALEPGQVYEFEIDLWATANLFKKGHRIALYVTSSDFPQFDRNTNAAGEGGPENIVVAHQRIFHDAQHPSHLVLPVIPR